VFPIYWKANSLRQGNSLPLKPASNIHNVLELLFQLPYFFINGLDTLFESLQGFLFLTEFRISSARLEPKYAFFLPESRRFCLKISNRPFDFFLSPWLFVKRHSVGGPKGVTDGDYFPKTSPKSTRDLEISFHNPIKIGNEGRTQFKPN